MFSKAKVQKMKNEFFLKKEKNCKGKRITKLLTCQQALNGQDLYARQKGKVYISTLYNFI